MNPESSHILRISKGSGPISPELGLKLKMIIFAHYYRT